MANILLVYDSEVQPKNIGRVKSVLYRNGHQLFGTYEISLHETDGSLTDAAINDLLNLASGADVIVVFESNDGILRDSYWWGTQHGQHLVYLVEPEIFPTISSWAQELIQEISSWLTRWGRRIRNGWSRRPVLSVNRLVISRRGQFPRSVKEVPGAIQRALDGWRPADFSALMNPLAPDDEPELHWGMKFIPTSLGLLALGALGWEFSDGLVSVAFLAKIGLILTGINLIRGFARLGRWHG